jgi:hypothetical protein
MYRAMGHRPISTKMYKVVTEMKMMKKFVPAIFIVVILCRGVYSESKPICTNPDPEADLVMGRWDFLSASDTSRWAYEDLPQTTGQPSVSWLSNYDGATGVVKVQFTEANQGVKITLLKPEWLSSSSTQWYRLRVRARSEDGPSDKVSFIGYLFNGLPPGPTDLTGDDLTRVPSSWVTLESYMNSVGGDTCMYYQFVIRNENKFPAAVYIDSAEISETFVPEMVDINYGGANFNTSKNVNDYWQFQNGFGAAWPESYRISSGKLKVTFSGTTEQSLKMTMGLHPGIVETHPVHPGKLVGQRAHVFFQGENKDSIIVVVSYGVDKAGGIDFTELGVTGRINRLVNGDNEIYQTIYLATQPYNFGQVIVKNESPSYFYLDEMYPLEER